MSNGSTVLLERKIPVHRGERGYNLIEVLVAMGILGSVLISVFTLFFMGRYNVYSGRQLTQAIGIANHVLEDMAPLNKQMIYNGAFNLNDTDSGSVVTFTNPAQTYNDARIRSTDPNVIPTPPTDISTEKAGGPGFLTKWTNLMAGKMNQGSVTVILVPRNDTNTPAQFGSATTMRVRVIVRWTERNRQRQVTLDTFKSF
jgi:prepilin-type N-terminal cleavage/methylation domain-containing protein